MQKFQNIIMVFLSLVLFSSSAFAEERYAMFNLNINFGSEGIHKTKLGLTSNFSNDKLHFSASNSLVTPIADLTLFSRTDSWNVRVLGNSILNSESYGLSVDSEETTDSTGRNIGKTILISGLVIGGIYLIASKAFEDNADDIAKRSLEDDQ